jgi:hypothetical protein
VPRGMWPGADVQGSTPGDDQPETCKHLWCGAMGAALGGREVPPRSGVFPGSQLVQPCRLTGIRLGSRVAHAGSRVSGARQPRRRAMPRVSPTMPCGQHGRGCAPGHPHAFGLPGVGLVAQSRAAALPGAHVVRRRRARSVTDTRSEAFACPGTGAHGVHHRSLLFVPQTYSKSGLQADLATRAQWGACAWRYAAPTDPQQAARAGLWRSGLRRRCATRGPGRERARPGLASRALQAPSCGAQADGRLACRAWLGAVQAGGGRPAPPAESPAAPPRLRAAPGLSSSLPARARPAPADPGPAAV